MKKLIMMKKVRKTARSMRFGEEVKGIHRRSAKTIIDGERLRKCSV